MALGNLRSPKFVAVTIEIEKGPHEFKFYAVSAENAVLLGGLIRQLGHAYVLWTQNQAPRRRVVEANDLRAFSNVTTTEVPTLDGEKFRQDQLHQAVDRIAEAIADKTTLDLVATLVVDSLRDEKLENSDVVSADITVLKPMIEGLLAGSSEITDPIFRSLRSAAARAEEDRKKTGGATPTTGSTSSTFSPKSPQPASTPPSLSPAATSGDSPLSSTPSVETALAGSQI